MKLAQSRLVYEQEEDSSGRSDVDFQTLTVEVMDAGGGPYAVISTERWAIGSTREEIEAFITEILRRVKEAE